MKQPHSIALSITIELEGRVLKVGDLKWSRDDRRAAFEYDAAALNARLALSPFRMKLAPGVIMASPHPFEGLHGLFADSLPDGWGRLLVDRQVSRNGGNPAIMTPLDRLAIVGANGMGALSYAPAYDITDDAPKRALKLDWFATQAENILAGQSDDGISKLLEASGGSAGARPKIMALKNLDTKKFSLDTGAIAKKNQEHWLIKLKHRKEGLDIGRIENAYAQMARAAQIQFPDTQLIEDKNGNAHFAVKRFDRTPLGRLHVHTLAGMVNADFRMPSLDYTDLLEVVASLSPDQNQVKEAFRRMVFNVIAGNRDDHAKNHAFTMDATGKWQLSPAYDVTPSDGPGGEHNMTVANEGRAPGQSHFAKVAASAGLQQHDANTIISEVAEAISSWKHHADANKIKNAEAIAIGKLIESNANAALGLKGAFLKSAAPKPPTKPRPKNSGKGGRGD